jgi:RNA polymerase sigma-70 factor, ECF subfamily
VTQRSDPPARFLNVETMAFTIERGAGASDADRAERLAQLFDRHHVRLYRFALRMASRDDEAGDLLQDAFVRAAQNIDRVPAGDDEAMSWLVRVVVNLARDRHRRRVVRDAFRHLLRAEHHDPRPALDAAAAVRTALASLPPRQRAVIVLHHLDEQPVAAVAAMLRISQVTVRWHLAAARKRMAAILGGRE